MTATESKRIYARLWIAMDDIQDAIQHALAAEKLERRGLAYAAHIKYATIAFLRALTNNQADGNTVKAINLDALGLHQDERKLIERAKVYRDKLFAHSDADIHAVAVSVEDGMVSILKSFTDQTHLAIDPTAFVRQLRAIAGKLSDYEDRIKADILALEGGGALIGEDAP